MSAPATRNTQVTVPGTDASVDLSALNAHIAAELASRLSDGASVRERYGISDAQWKTLVNSPVFRSMLREAIEQWDGQLNAGARIQKKADIVLEDAIPAYDGMIHNKDIPAQARIDAGKLLAQLAGRTAKAEGTGAGVGGGFTLNINVGGGKEKLVIDAGKVTADVDEQ